MAAYARTFHLWAQSDRGLASSKRTPARERQNSSEFPLRARSPHAHLKDYFSAPSPATAYGSMLLDTLVVASIQAGTGASRRAPTTCYFIILLSLDSGRTTRSISTSLAIVFNQIGACESTPFLLLATFPPPLLFSLLGIKTIPSLLALKNSPALLPRRKANVFQSSTSLPPLKFIMVFSGLRKCPFDTWTYS